MKLCPKCNIEHQRPGAFCSRTCANSRGPRSDEVKLAISATLTGNVQGESTIKKRSGNNHPKRKGRNLPDYKNINCLCCGNEFLSKRETNKFCNRNCYNNHFKEIRTEWEQYSIECQFKFNVYDYSQWMNLDLLNKFGWYKASNKGNNLTGVSRDHAYSVKAGFRHGVDSKIISHPANCVLMQQDDNSKKKTNCSITLDQLLERIGVIDRAYEGSSLQN